MYPFPKLPECLAGALYSHVIFLVICESNANGASAYVDSEPNATPSNRGDAGEWRSLREDTRCERLYRFNPCSSTGPFSSSIREY